MTEQVEATSVEIQAESPVQVEAPESTPVEASQDAPKEVAQEKQERLLPERQVKKIAAQQKREGYESGRRAAMEEFQRQQTQSQPSGETMGGMAQMSQDQVRQLIQQEAAKMSNLAIAQKIESNFLSKVDQAREKYEDFDEKYAALNIEQHPHLLLWMDGMDNVGDMVYDMASNPEKVASIMMLASSGFPQLAQQKLAQLSASIKANEAAQKQPTAPAPLSQIQPTAVGTGNGLETVTDYRSASWLRG